MKLKDNLPDELYLNYKLFIDKTTVIYGPSGSGKSTIIIDIMYHLSEHIKQIIVISPTDPSNHTYSNGVVPLPLIHYKLTDELIKKIWKRQEMFASVYSRVNNINTLRGLFNKLGLGAVERVLERAHSVKAERVAEVNEQTIPDDIKQHKIEEIEETFNNFFVLVYKSYITKNKSMLLRMKLTSNEHFALKYLHMENPRMLIIFDDCSTMFKKLRNESKEILEKMFFQGRWADLTTILAVHDDKMLDSEIRKNAYVSMFTTGGTASSYTTRPTNPFPKTTIKKVNGWCDDNSDLFKNHQKLAYVRAEDKFYRFTAAKHENDFCFGDETLQNFCRMVEAEGGSIDKSNEFYNYFNT